MLSTPAGRFRLIAIAEACSWIGLLIGMLFEHVLRVTDIGVKIFGPVHGGLFVIYVLLAFLVRKPLGWDNRTLVWALVASIPPAATVWFERWAARTGRMEPVADSVTA
ncbi:DUF3817 domain-containing protein [Allokutzneria albata]|uniref:DUF3817 domain-containing protein n=1 Tax=Allokutzneria albata TaxID=211114 RepID=UPI0004C36B96|nr:DUF3817 domain-containing protein [Allokutzneria albata]